MEEKKELWKGIFYVVVGIILCVKILDSCVSCDSDKEQLDETTIEQVEETSTEQEQEAPKKEEKKDPIANFVGTYYLYDKAGHQGEKIFVVDDGRLFYVSGGNGENILCGTITPISDKVFKIRLEDDLMVFGVGNNKVGSYKKGQNTVDYNWKVQIYKTVVFDFSEMKMYLDKTEYDNRDYSSAEYCFFKFSK